MLMLLACVVAGRLFAPTCLACLPKSKQAAKKQGSKQEKRSQAGKQAMQQAPASSPLH